MAVLKSRPACGLTKQAASRSRTSLAEMVPSGWCTCGNGLIILHVIKLVR